MDLVVDANVIFSAIIKKGKAHELLFDDRVHLFTPEYFFSEFEEHSVEIMDKTGQSEEDVKLLLDGIKSKISLIPLEELSPFLEEAENICPDKDDVVYFALALKMGCAIWSQDKALKEKQNKVQVYSTDELCKML